MADNQPLQVVAFHDCLAPILQDLLELSSTFAEDCPLIAMTLLLKQAFDNMISTMEFGLFENEPVDQMQFLSQQPLARDIEAIQRLRSQYRSSEFFNHLSSISESILCLNWMAVRPAPRCFIVEMLSSAQFYGNRVLSHYRQTTETNHVNYINKYYLLLRELENLIRQYFVTGFQWGSCQGGMNQPVPKKSIFSIGGSALPPPPPPPPPAAPMPPRDLNEAGDFERAALIAELNQGTAITNRLRPTNRAPVQQTTAPAAAATAPRNQQARNVVVPAVYRPLPKFLLEGRKWIVEHQRDNTLTVENEMNQTVLIHNCQLTNVKILNKITGITIENSKRVNIVLSDVISSLELIGCQRIQVQCDGVIPLINVSSSDIVNIFVNEQSRRVEIIAAKSSALNVSVVQPDGDFHEMPVPEQIKSVLSQDGRKLNSTVLENM